MAGSPSLQVGILDVCEGVLPWYEKEPLAINGSSITVPGASTVSVSVAGGVSAVGGSRVVDSLKSFSTDSLLHDAAKAAAAKIISSFFMCLDFRWPINVKA